jgi:hypothetical protein
MMLPFEIACFWSKVEGGAPNRCWPWRGRLNHNGYGRYKDTMAHRVAFELIKGRVPENLIVRHVCDNPLCCNPKHLLAGTHKDNSRDAVQRKRIACGERNGNTQLTEEQALYIRRNPDGKTGKDLAAMFSVARSTISYIQSGRSWSRLNGGG